MTLGGPIIIAGRRSLRVVTLVGVMAMRASGRTSGSVTLTLSGVAVGRAVRIGSGSALMSATGQTTALRKRSGAGQALLAMFGAGDGRKRLRAVGAATLGLGGTVIAGRRYSATAFGSLAMSGQANGSVSTLEPEANALFARMTTQPSDARQGAINALIAGLKADGLWGKLPVFNIRAAHDAQAARLNWKDSTFTATPVNAPNFLADRGYQGDGATSYLNMGAGLATVPLIGPANISMFVWSLTDVMSTAIDIGTLTTDSNYITTRYTDGKLYSYMGLPGNPLFVDVPSSVGLFAVGRSGAVISAYRNGTLLSTNAAGATPTTLASGNLTELRGLSYYSPRRIAASIVGVGLTAAEHAALYARLLTYMQAVGAVA